MFQSLITLGHLIGGLGLFLLAIGMITDGLKQAAGHAIRDILGKWTRTPGHGILTGLSITAIVQSSTAVTVATIGFVNAGLMSMYQALGVVYGTNLGTTVTGWLVAIIGFKINVNSFALPIIGIGMLLRLTGGESRRASLGMALTGFGLFFIGIDVLKEAFEGVAVAIDLQKFTLDGVAGMLIYVGIGFVMTVITQSSIAAIAITLTAATSGVLGLYAAAAMVIGANLGTTSTAVIVAIGATANAKRVAAAHVIFNLLTGMVALLILPVLFLVVNSTSKFLGLEDIPAVTLALFHTAFNVLGVLIMWPLNDRLAHFLGKRFVTQEEVEGRPRYLDKIIEVTPTLAINALILELSRMTSVARRMSMEALSTESVAGKQISSDHRIARQLAVAVAEFIARLERGLMSEQIAEQLAKALRAEQHLLSSANQAVLVVKSQLKLEIMTDEKLKFDLADYYAQVVKLMALSNPEDERFSYLDCEEQLEKVQAAYTRVKADLLHAGAESRIRIPYMIEMLEHNSLIRRMARQMFKAVSLLNELYIVSEVRVKKASDVEDASATGKLLAEDVSINEKSVGEPM